MRGRVAAIEQTSRGQAIDAGANTGDPAGLRSTLSQPIRDRIINRRLAQSAAASNNNGVELRRAPQTLLRFERGAGLGFERRAGQPDGPDFVKRNASAIPIIERGRGESIGRSGQVRRGHILKAKNSDLFRRQICNHTE